MRVEGLGCVEFRISVGSVPLAMERELMAPRLDRKNRITSGVASWVTTSHAAKGCVLVNLIGTGNLEQSSAM